MNPRVVFRMECFHGKYIVEHKFCSHFVFRDSNGHKDLKVKLPIPAQELFHGSRVKFSTGQLDLFRPFLQTLNSLHGRISLLVKLNYGYTGLEKSE